MRRGNTRASSSATANWQSSTPARRRPSSASRTRSSSRRRSSLRWRSHCAANSTRLDPAGQDPHGRCKLHVHGSRARAGARKESRRLGRDRLCRREERTVKVFADPDQYDDRLRAMKAASDGPKPLYRHRDLCQRSSLSEPSLPHCIQRGAALSEEPHGARRYRLIALPAVVGCRTATIRRPRSLLVPNMHAVRSPLPRASSLACSDAVRGPPRPLL